VAEARRILAEGGVPEGGVVVGELLDGADAPEVGPEPDPPTAAEVRRRAIVTAAVAARALAELDGQHLAEARAGLLDWVEATGAAEALEPWEARLLAAPPGGIAERDLTNGAWRTEGAAVLAWALGAYELPGPDALAPPGDVYRAIGLADPALTDAALDLASPRDPAELERCRQRLLTIHWRLREHALRPGPLDLAAAVAQAAWGPLTLDGVPVVDGDLALGGVALADAPEDLVARARSIAVERHRAINWLHDGGSFEDTDVST